MSRASDGTYTAPTNSWNPAVEGTAIDETDWNSILDDIETALTDSLSVSGKGKVTAHIDFDENGSPGTPASNVGRLYAGDDSGLTTVYWKDASGNTYNLLQGAASGLTYQFDTSTTTSSDPGAGKVRFNNATLASVTEIAIDDSTAAGADVSAFILTWDDAASSIKGTVFVQKRTSPSTIAIFNITGTSTDESGWTRLAVTYVTHNGSLAANDPISVAFSAAGTGTNGATGATGPNAGLDYAFNTATSGDPGSGKLLFDSATIASVTQVNISETGRNSEALAAVIATWDDSTNTAHYGHLRIFDVADRTKFIELEITGTITDAGSYRTIPVTYTAGGTLPSNNAVLAVMFERTGNKGADGAGTGDVSGPASSVDSEIALFSSTTGKVIKRASLTGLVKATSGVASAAVSGTDYAPATSGSSVLKGNGSGGFSSAVSGTDIVVPGGALGTPSSGTLTNCSGLPASGLVASTSQAVGFGSIELGHATDTTIARSSAGVVTIEGSVIQMAGVQEWFIPATSFAPRTTGGCATLATLETTTNRVNLPYLAFDGAGAKEFAQVQIPRMPKSWNEGTITAVVVWLHPSTTTNFATYWGISAVALSDADAADTAFGTEVFVQDTGGATNTIYHSPATSAITIGNTPAEGDTVIIQVSRDSANASPGDTMTVDAFFLGLLIRVTTNAANDA